MQNVFFLKEAIANADKNVSLIILNQKQIKESINFSLSTFLAQQKPVIVISLATSPDEIIKSVSQNAKNNLYVIDCFSGQKSNDANIISAGSPSDLTNIQVSLDLIEKKNKTNKIIIFDSISVLAVYNNKETLGRFLHLFTNKMILNENTTFFFAPKDAIEEETLSMIKELSTKTYDYSGLIISSIEEAK